MIRDVVGVKRRRKAKPPIDTPWQRAVAEAWKRLATGRTVEGINDKTRRNFEQSKHAATLSTIEQLCRAAGLNPSVLFTQPEVIAAGSHAAVEDVSGGHSGGADVKSTDRSFPVAAGTFNIAGHEMEGASVVQPLTEDEWTDVLNRRRAARMAAGQKTASEPDATEPRARRHLQRGGREK